MGASGELLEEFGSSLRASRETWRSWRTFEWSLMSLEGIWEDLEVLDDH